MLAVEDGVRDPVWVTAGRGLEIGALPQSLAEFLVATIMSRPLESASAEEEPLGDLTTKGPSLDKFSKNPWVPAGAILTAAVLAGGIAAFQRGNVIWSQRMMRARVAAQGATILILAASVGMFQNPKPNDPS